MNLLAEIQTACRELSEHRAQLRRRHELRQKAVRVIDAEHAPELRRLQEKCSATRGALLSLLEQARAEFRKPKSREFHGITVGFEKSRDSILPPADDVLIDRIEKLLPPKQAETVLDRSVKIIKTAFKKLPREILQRLGCALVSGADLPVVRANDDDIETLVEKSLGSAAQGLATDEHR